MVSFACSQRLKPSVFRHQHLTITRRKDSKNQQPWVSSKVSFIISSPLTALFFLVQKVSLLHRRGADSSSGNIKMVFLCERAAVVSDLSSDGIWSSPRRRLLSLSSSTPQRARKTSGSIIVTSSTPELILFHRRLLGMIINAPGYQQALPPIIKKTRITPGALLREEEKEMFSVIYCTVPPVAAPHQIIPPPACASVQIFLVSKRHVNNLASGRSPPLCFVFCPLPDCKCGVLVRTRLAQTCVNHVKVCQTL